MKLPYYYTIDTWIISAVQFAVMLISIVAGRASRKVRRGDYGENPGNVAVVTTLYGVMGLLIAFTFGASAERFKQRKEVIVKESNCISTAIYRIGLYADSVQPVFKMNFKLYLESRIAYYEAERDTVRIRVAMRKADMYAAKIWAIAALHSRIPANLVASNQMVPALNAMFDIGNTRFWGEYDRTPPSILTMLFFLSSSAAFMIGYTSAEKGVLDWTRATFFCFFTSLIIFFIIDLDKPRSGIIKIDNHHQAITNLRSMLY
jgi:hypothetical protein